MLGWIGCHAATGSHLSCRQSAAILYSLVDSARLAGVETEACLRYAILAALDGKPIPHEVAEALRS